MNDDVRDTPPEAPKKSGLKLACLIVVIVGVAGLVVLGTLAALLIPALSAAREKARRTACLVNLKQLSMAMESYVGDYNGHLPATLEILVGGGYISDPGPLYCPSRKESREARKAALVALDGAARSGLNAQDTAEAVRAAARPHYLYVRYQTVKEMRGAPVAYDEAENHEEGRNVLFGDWHAAWHGEQGLPERFAREAEQVPAFKEYLDKNGIDGVAPR